MAERDGHSATEKEAGILPPQMNQPGATEGATQALVDGVETKIAEDQSKTVEDANPEHVYPTGTTLASILTALMLSIFLIAIDRTIIATAIPVITDHFNSLKDVSWYASAYLITACALLPISGKIYTFYPPKWVFLAQIVIFEIGSAICGGAGSSVAFIVGRAVAGAGSSGIFSGAIILITDSVPLHKRSSYTGMFGAVFGLSSVIGPLVGGALTQHASWRWNFLINLPIGAIVVVIVWFIMPSSQPMKKNLTITERVNQLDPIGNLFLLPSMICLLLALQWGGSEYAWSDGRVIALFVVFGITIIAFIGIQIWKKDAATIPPRIFTQRSILAGSWFTICIGGSFMIIVYYLPIWFQGIKGVSAVDSGVRVLPMILSMVIASIGSGFAIRKFGQYVPFVIACSVILSIASGLFTLLKVNSSTGIWFGFQVIYGFGLGLGMQQSSLAAQAALERKDVPVGVSIIMFAQLLGGAIFTAVAQNTFANKLVEGVSGIPGFDPRTVINVGATDLRRAVPAESLSDVLESYNAAIVTVFYVATGLSVASLFGGLGMEWISTLKDVKAQQGAKDEEEGTFAKEISKA